MMKVCIYHMIKSRGRYNDLINVSFHICIDDDPHRGKESSHRFALLYKRDARGEGDAPPFMHPTLLARSIILIHM
jgi:hypothetical protein